MGRLRDQYPPSSSGRRAEETRRPVSTFYKAWDKWGSLGNFSPHPITLTLAKVNEYLPAVSSEKTSKESIEQAEQLVANSLVWRSVEHYYQASKFSLLSSEGRDIVEQVRECIAPEDAARIGRLNERSRPDLLRPDWLESKVEVMGRALRAKFAQHEGPREMLRSSRGQELVESSPHDFVWGRGYNGRGRNQLGKLLMQIRDEI